MKTIDWNLVEEQFLHLPLQEQMRMLERLMRRMRESAYLDISPEEFERAMDEMARDPAIQRELRMLPHPTDIPDETKESA
jgi:hypothetical protein